MKRRSFIIALSALLIIACSNITSYGAEDITADQQIKNENSYLGLNLEKQPQQEKGKQFITNKKSFLFVNIIINGKCMPDYNTVQDKQK